MTYPDPNYTGTLYVAKPGAPFPETGKPLSDEWNEKPMYRYVELPVGLDEEPAVNVYDLSGNATDEVLAILFEEVWKHDDIVSMVRRTGYDKLRKVFGYENIYTSFPAVRPRVDVWQEVVLP